MHRHDDGLAAGLAVHGERVDRALRRRHGLRVVEEARSEMREVDASGEVAAVGVEDATAEVRVAVEAAVGESQFIEHLAAEGVAFVDAVESHQPDVFALLGGDEGHDCL